MKHIDKKSSNKAVAGLFLALSAWLFSCICWRFVDSPARQSISTTHAARTLLGKDAKDFVKYAKRAAKILDFFSISTPTDADQ